MKSTFNIDELRSIDLNLLLVLSVMVREENVRRTAERLRVGSPAISMALGRLRTMFGDPLFVRSGRGMSATPRARELGQLVDPFLGDLHTSLKGPSSLDPASMSRHLRLAIADDLEMILLPRLLQRIRAEAQGVTIHIQDADFQSVDAPLQAGDADVSVVALVGTQRPVAPHRTIYREHFVALFDGDHSGVATPISLDDYVRASHLLISPRGEQSGLTEVALGELGAARDVVATLTRFSTLGPALRNTGLICNVPSTVGTLLARDHRLSLSPLPFEAPQFEVGIVWQRSLNADPFTAWIVDMICQMLGEIRSRSRP